MASPPRSVRARVASRERTSGRTGHDAQPRRRSRMLRRVSTIDPTVAMCRSLSGLTMEAMPRMAPSAMSSAQPRAAALRIPHQGAGAAVDGQRLNRAAERPAESRPGQHRAGNVGAAHDRVPDRGCLAASVPPQHDVLREERLERTDVAALDGCEERWMPAVPAAGARRRNVGARRGRGDGRGRPAGERSAPSDRGSRRSRRTRSRRRRGEGGRLAARARGARARPGRRTRGSRASRRVAPGSPSGDSTSGSGSQSPMYCSRRTRADRRWSIARRVEIVVTYATGESITLPVSRTR